MTRAQMMLNALRAGPMDTRELAALIDRTPNLVHTLLRGHVAKSNVEKIQPTQPRGLVSYRLVDVAGQRIAGAIRILEAHGYRVQPPGIWP